MGKSNKNLGSTNPTAEKGTTGSLCKTDGKGREIIAHAGMTAFQVLAGVVVGVVVGSVYPLRGVHTVSHAGQPRATAVKAAPVRMTGTITKPEQARAWAYLHGKMPRAGFTGLEPDPYIPGLLHVETGKPNDPVFFNPREHALIIGLVVNLDNPAMPIAPGISLPSGLIK